MKKLSVYQMTTCAIMAALMCVLGPMSIPIGPIPVSLTNFVIYLTVMLIGGKLATVSYLLYLFLGAAGMPVFSGYQGGPAKLAGPTGGYLIGFILMALISGWFVRKFRDRPVVTVLGMALATLVAYAFGTGWFVLMMKCELWYALTVCVFPFVPFDLAKIVLAVLQGAIIYKALQKSGVLGIREAV